MKDTNLATSYVYVVFASILSEFVEVLNLNILHTNNVQALFEQFNEK